MANDPFIMMIHRSSNSDTHAHLASNLRRLRIARHISLSQLARDTSMSKATLSGIESGRANPTLDTLTALAAALGVPVTALLAGAPVGEVHIVRASETHPWPPEGAAQRLLQDTVRLRGSLQIIELALPAHHVSEPEPRSGGSREALLVLQGKLIAGPTDRISELASGDYASFPADDPYLYETSRAPARALVLKHTAG